MKILFVPKEFPHAKVIGGPILVYNRIKYLSKNHQVGLATFMREEDKKYLPTIEPYLFEIETIHYPPKRSRFRKMYDFFFSPVPNYLCNTKSKQMSQKVAEMTHRSDYDVVVAEYSVMGQYLYKNMGINPKTKRIVSCHESYSYARHKVLKTYGLFSKKGFSALLDMYRLKKYEISMYKNADLVLTLTEEEKARLLKHDPELRIEVVPHGTDTDFFYFAPIYEREQCVAYLGNYQHDPNRDAVIYFINEIWPKVKRAIPGIKFYVIGRKPTKDMMKASKIDSEIIITDELEDVREYLKRARVFIAPIRLGGGFRGKILEAMSMGIPIVATSIASEGLTASNNENIMIADDPENFVENITLLFRDEKKYKFFSENSRRIVEENYSYKKVVEKLENVIKKVVQQSTHDK